MCSCSPLKLILPNSICWLSSSSSTFVHSTLFLQKAISIHYLQTAQKIHIGANFHIILFLFSINLPFWASRLSSTLSLITQEIPNSCNTRLHRICDLQQWISRCLFCKFSIVRIFPHQASKAKKLALGEIYPRLSACSLLWFQCVHSMI